MGKKGGVVGSVQVVAYSHRSIGYITYYGRFRRHALAAFD